jgi:nicotinate-nucleotide pyrophosphorylase (carboxylating)
VIDRSQYLPVIRAALAEDLGPGIDLTSESVIPADASSMADFVVRSRGVVAGIEIARAVFDTVDPTVVFTDHVSDGAAVEAGEVIARVEGRTRSILLAERTALNLMGRMSGVATATRHLVDAVDGLGVRIADTRKTMPGLRVLDKQAVKAGGGMNHRMGLYDAVLIKDNHIAAAGDIAAAVAAAREAVGDGVMVEVEVETLDQLAVALETPIDRVMLDNMDIQTMRRAVEIVRGRVEVEASGGVTLDNVRDIAATGVDLISVGWITHSAPQLDIALDFV